ncbi:hypothetical protein T05_14119 [Trichinella murrelli]|uniref:Uncharacterized protein n=1 Tax=Trichinella murrelli TaxID=144512 RepID=A0A0V0T4T5_9BILA|nr:hypothetical protein T05_14119 [Trichinella murrelli]
MIHAHNLEAMIQFKEIYRLSTFLRITVGNVPNIEAIYTPRSKQFSVKLWTRLDRITVNA